MALYATDNRYPGINIHLNNDLQQRGGSWRVFHSGHIIHLATTIDAALPDGYMALYEESVQLEGTTTPPDETIQVHVRPDVTVYQDEGRYPEPSPKRDTTLQATRYIPLPETFTTIETNMLKGIVIYQIRDDAPHGQPVTRIELLSPSNKPPHAHYAQYMYKRRQTLQAGLCLVEIDYLHTIAPISDAIPRYPHHADAHPFTVFVNDPRPTFEQGTAALYSWGIDDPLPQILIPLADTDTVIMDLATAYDMTFKSLRAFAQRCDYAQDPVALNTLRDDDQQRIKDRLQTIRRTVAKP